MSASPAPLAVVILAAGQGKRMASDLPKVLHPLGGRPMLAHLLATVGALVPAQCLVVYGHGGEAVRETFAEQTRIIWVEQTHQLGTGHALDQALPYIPDDQVVLVLYGDVPLVQEKTLCQLVETARFGCVGLLTAELRDPIGYGRIVRDPAGRLVRIVEEKDATPEERRIHEANTGILAAPAKELRAWVSRLDNGNRQGEYYLTDTIEMAVAQGVELETVSVADSPEVRGVNDRCQLAELERFYQRQQAQRMMLNGATLLDPARVDVRGNVTTGKDVVIDVNVVFEGDVRLGNRVHIGPHCVIRDAVLGDDTHVLSHTCIDGARVGQGVRIGPFARLRPGVRLDKAVRIGNFVEVKAASIGRGSKINHLSYIGDAEVGAGVNVGAGSITCNYDGVNKHRTIIEDHVFLGSNTALVAPVRVGKNATTGAGSTINRDVPDESLGIARARQKIIHKWLPLSKILAKS